MLHLMQNKVHILYIKSSLISIGAKSRCLMLQITTNKLHLGERKVKQSFDAFPGDIERWR